MFGPYPIRRRYLPFSFEEVPQYTRAHLLAIICVLQYLDNRSEARVLFLLT